MVKDWQSKALANDGVVVKDTQENATLLYSTQFFTIHQVPDESYFPRLVVTYLIPDEIYATIVMVIAETALFSFLLLRGRREAKH